MANESQELKALGELRAWLGTVASALDIAMEEQSHRQQALARRTIAKRCDQRQAELQWDSRLRASESTLQATLELLRAWTARGTMPDMMLLLTDVRVRTDLAEEAFGSWRMTLAELQMRQLSEEDSDEFDQAVIKATQYHTRYLLYVNNALQLIPQEQELLS